MNTTTGFGLRPDVTKAQVVAAIIALIPIVANLLRAFGVYDLSEDEQDALKQAVFGATAFAGLLVIGDAGLRSARNHADAKVQAAALTPLPSPAQGGDPITRDAAALAHAEEEELLSEETTGGRVPDEEELSSPPPDASNAPVQPTEAGPDDAPTR